MSVVRTVVKTRPWTGFPCRGDATGISLSSILYNGNIMNLGRHNAKFFLESPEIGGESSRLCAAKPEKSKDLIFSPAVVFVCLSVARIGGEPTSCLTFSSAIVRKYKQESESPLLNGKARGRLSMNFKHYVQRGI